MDIHQVNNIKEKLEAYQNLLITDCELKKLEVSKKLHDTLCSWKEQRRVNKYSILTGANFEGRAFILVDFNE